MAGKPVSDTAHAVSDTTGGWQPGLRESYLFDRNVIAEIHRAAREGMQSAARVRVVPAIKVHERIEHRDGSLRRSCAIQIDERPALDVLIERGKCAPPPVDP